MAHAALVLLAVALVCALQCIHTRAVPMPGLCGGGDGGGDDGGGDGCGSGAVDVATPSGAIVEKKKGNRLILVTAATRTDHQGLKRLERTCGFYGVDVVVIGNQDDYRGNFQKVSWYRNVLTGIHAGIAPGTLIDDEPYVMFTDAHDVVCNNGPESVFTAMEQQYPHARVLFSAELTQYPKNDTLHKMYDDYLKESSEPYARTTGFKYLNSGGFMGKPSHLMECLFAKEPLIPLLKFASTDQAYFAQAFFLAHERCGFVLDFAQQIFGSVAGCGLGHRFHYAYPILRHVDYLGAERGVNRSPFTPDHFGSHHINMSGVNHATSIEKWVHASHIEMIQASTRPFHIHGPGPTSKGFIDYFENFIEANGGWSLQRQKNKSAQIRAGGDEVMAKQFRENFNLPEGSSVETAHPYADGICVAIVDVAHDPFAPLDGDDSNGYEVDGGNSTNAMMKGLLSQRLPGVNRLAVFVVTHRSSFLRRVASHLQEGKDSSLLQGKTMTFIRTSDEMKAMSHCVLQSKMDGYLKIDSWTVLTSPHTISWLMSRNVPMIAPLLYVDRTAELWFEHSNFWLNDTRPFNTTHVRQYAHGELHIQQNLWRHMWNVRVVKYCYFIRGSTLQRLVLHGPHFGPNDKYKRSTRKGFEESDHIIDLGVEFFDSQISSRVREMRSIKESLFLDNTVDFGHRIQGQAPPGATPSVVPTVVPPVVE